MILEIIPMLADFGISLGLLIASLVLTAASTVYSVQAQKEQGEAAEDMANYNAAVEQNSALASEQQSQYEADRVRDRNRRLTAQQTSAYAKAGVDISGSASDVMFDSAIQGELDYLANLYTGKVQSTELRAGAQLSRAEGGQAKAQSRRNMGATILGGLSSGVNTAASYKSGGSGGGGGDKQPKFRGSSGQSASITPSRRGPP